MTVEAPSPAPEIGVTRISYVVPLVSALSVACVAVPPAVSAVVQVIPSRLFSTWNPLIDPAGAPLGSAQPTVTVWEAVLTIWSDRGALGSADAFAAKVAGKPLPKLVIALTRNV